MSDEILRILGEQQRTLGNIEGKLEQLVGNGQPGLIKEMRDDIDSLKATRSNAKGYAAGITGAFTIFEFLVHFLAKKVGH